MKKALLVLPVIAICLLMSACEPLEQRARDTSAALGGAIVSAQTQNQVACKASPTASACVLINKSIAAQNALITADEAYCGFTPGTPLTAPCVPIKTAQGGLVAAIANATPFITALKGIIQ